MSRTNNNCVVCGKPNGRNKLCCSHKCYSEYRQNYKTCVVCGKQFADAKANDTKCCSPECSKLHKRLQHTQTDIYRTADNKMLERKKQFWEAHQGEKHINTKSWKVQSPTGKIYECVNLKEFVRQNIDLFYGSTVKQAHDGFIKIKASQQGKRKNPVYQYKGWKLLAWKD